MCTVRTLRSDYETLEEGYQIRRQTSISISEYLQVLCLPAAGLTILCVMLNVVADIYVLITLNSHLQQFHLTTIEIGCVYLCLFLSYGLSSPIAGRLADRSNHEFLLQFFGSMVIVVAFVIIGPAKWTNLEPKLYLVVIGLLLKGIGAGPLISCSFSACLKAAKIYAGRRDDFQTYTLVSTIISFSIPLG